MAFCTNCGAALKEGGKFCGSCGTPVASPAVQQTNAAPQKSAAEFIKSGRAAIEKEDWDAAAADYAEAIKLAPKNAEAWCGRGKALYRRGMAKVNDEYKGMDTSSDKDDWKNAIEDLTKAIELNIRFAKAYTYRGHSYIWLDEWETGLADLYKAVAIDPDDQECVDELEALAAAVDEELVPESMLEKLEQEAEKFAADLGEDPGEMEE
jgi:tetratricopeptide (TPR) repeat protein